MNNIKYLIWLLGVVIWNYSVPGAKPIYDIGVAIFLKHMFEINRLIPLKY